MLEPATVVSVHGVWVRLRDGDGRIRRAKPRRHLEALASGDQVQVRWQHGAGHIEAVHPRRSLLVRTDRNGSRRPVAANLDQVLVVAAPRPVTPVVFIDRCLLNLEVQALPAVLVLNKSDLTDDAAGTSMRAVERRYAGIGYPVLRTSVLTGNGLDTLREALHGRSSLLVGVSGAGKSSLAGAVVPDADVTVGALTGDGTHGAHTTSSARLIELPGGGTLVDSPGVRDFATWQVAVSDVAGGFREFRTPGSHCQYRDCRHHVEPGCGVRAALAAGDVSGERYASYLAILAESEAAERDRYA